MPLLSPRRKSHVKRDVPQNADDHARLIELAKQLDDLLVIVHELRADVDALKGGVIR